MDTRIENDYFPETAVASIVAPMSDGTAVETATIGHEGFVGLPVFLGTTQMSAQCFLQVPGTAYQMSVGPFRRLLLDRDEALHRVAAEKKSKTDHAADGGADLHSPP